MKGRRNNTKPDDATQSGGTGKPMFTHDGAVALVKKRCLSKAGKPPGGFDHLSARAPLSAKTP